MNSKSGKRLLAVLLALVSLLTSGCTSYRTLRIAHNGGDAPPFVAMENVKEARTENLGAGDTVAVLSGNIKRVLPANETTVYLVERGQEIAEKKPVKAKNSPDNKGQTKSQRKSEEEKDKRTKSQRKADDKQSSSKSASKSSNNQPSKAESKKPQAKVSLSKYVRLGSQTALSKDINGIMTSVRIRKGEDSDSVFYSLALNNFGDADYIGDVDIYDELPEGLGYLSISSVFERTYNSYKKGLAFVPIIGLIGLFLPDYVDQPLGQDRHRLTDLSKGSLVRYKLANVRVPEGTQLIVDFSAKVQKW